MTSIALTQRPVFSADADLKRLINWVILWVGLPNVCFMLLWFVGAPKRHIEIITVGLVGLIAKRFPKGLQYACYAGAIVFCALCFIGGLFNLSFSSLAYSIRFLLEIQPSNSIEYLLVGGALLLVLGLGYKQVQKDTNFERPLYILGAGLLVFNFAMLDIWMGEGMRGHYKRTAPDDAIFTSASNSTGFAARADGNRHLVLILVESLGNPAGNSELKRLLFKEFKDSDAVADRYELSEGTSLYFNSTTAGEVRELCGRWGDYYELVETKDPNCLPAQLGKKGYNTIAMHSFTDTFFQRGEWYPNIGFKKREFSKELREVGARKCGGVFAGACDRDIPAHIGNTLRAAKKPTFLYWLTLNSHLPVPPGLNLNVDNCQRVSPILARDFPQICRQVTIYHDINVELVKEITARNFPEADILLVGDHMPPYFDRHHRTQFDPTKVPWLYLRHKSATPSRSI